MSKPSTIFLINRKTRSTAAVKCFNQDDFIAQYKAIPPELEFKGVIDPNGFFRKATQQQTNPV